MRWWTVWAAIALVVLWAVAKFMLAVTSAMIHLVLLAAVVLLILGLIRGATRRSSPPP